MTRWKANENHEAPFNQPFLLRPSPFLISTRVIEPAITLREAIYGAEQSKNTSANHHRQIYSLHTHVFALALVFGHAHHAHHAHSTYISMPIHLPSSKPSYTRTDTYPTSTSQAHITSLFRRIITIFIFRSITTAHTSQVKPATRGEASIFQASEPPKHLPVHSEMLKSLTSYALPERRIPGHIDDSEIHVSNAKIWSDTIIRQAHSRTHEPITEQKIKTCQPAKSRPQKVR